MTFEQSIVTCLRKYATFEGRANRAEYWWFQAFILLMLVAVITLSTLGEALGGWAFILFGLGLFVPNIAAGVRRLHDIGWSGWAYLIVLLPFGSIVMLVLMVLPGQEGANKYGPVPGWDDPRDPPSHGGGGFGAPVNSPDNSRIPRVPRPK